MFEKEKMILTIYKMCYIIALKNRKNIENKQIAHIFEQNRTQNDHSGKG